MEFISDKKQQNVLLGEFLFWLYLITIFIITYFITYKHVYIVINSDFYAHAKLAEEIGVKDFWDMPIASYPMWHMLVFLVNKITNISFFKASIFVSCIVNILIYLSIEKSINILSYEKKSKIQSSTMAFILMIVMPIFIPAFNDKLYLGQLTPNVWHNPTFMMVKLLALWTFIKYIKITDVEKYTNQKEYRNNIILFSIFLVLSTLAKPSFVQVFIPAVIIDVIYRVLKKDEFIKHKVVNIIIALIPTLTIIAIQTNNLFVGNEELSGVEISFLEVWRIFSPNPIISVILGLLFPLIFLIYSRKEKIMGASISWNMCLVGIMQYAFLIENGRRAYHGNFAWGMFLGGFFLWLTSISKFNDIIILRKNKIYIFMVLILGMHFISGIYYVIQLVTIPDFIY